LGAFDGFEEVGGFVFLVKFDENINGVGCVVEFNIV
jgi:hypothetical protein